MEVKEKEEQKVGERQKVEQWWNRQRSWRKTTVENDHKGDYHDNMDGPMSMNSSGVLHLQ